MMIDERNSNEALVDFDPNRVRQSIVVNKIDYVSDQVLSQVLQHQDKNAETVQASDVEPEKSKSTTSTGKSSVEQQMKKASAAKLRKARRSIIPKTTSKETRQANDAKLEQTSSSVTTSKTPANEADEKNTASDAKLEVRRSMSTETSSKNIMDEGLPPDQRNGRSSHIEQTKLSDTSVNAGNMSIVSENDVTSPGVLNITKSIIESISTNPELLPKSISGHLANDFGRNLSDSLPSGDTRRMSRYTRGSIRGIMSKRESIVPSAEPLPTVLEDMDNRQLVNAVNELQKNTRYLDLENKVLLHFLEANDPSLLEGMTSILEVAQNRQDRASVCSRKLTRQSLSHATHSRRFSKGIWDSGSSLAPTAVEKEGPRINITQKTDIVLREIEDIKNAMEGSIRRFQFARYKLKGQIEEMFIRESEIRDTWSTFEDVFLTGTVEKYAQKKNPAEKFMRFMEEWFTKSRLVLDKIRLRTSSLQVQYQKLCHQLNQKQLLGENLQIVDFEQLQIENKRLSEKIEHRNLLLIELKKMNGQANLLLSRSKKQIFKKLNYLKQIETDISSREDLTAKFDMECEKISVELEGTKDEHDKIKTRTENYEVPEVMDYLRKKAELSILKKNLKIWERRKQIQDMALLASVREMKNFTGKSTAESWWFKPPKNTQEVKAPSGDTFEFKFQRPKPSSVNPKHNRRNTKTNI